MVKTEHSAKTAHSICRGQQRGITDEMVALLQTYGSTYRHAKADLTCFDRKSWSQVVREKACEPQILEKLRNCYLVEIDGRLITVGHRTKRFRRDAH